MNIKDRSFLEGMWFHSLNKDGKLEWQGKILLIDPVSKMAILQLYSWMDGDATEKILVDCKHLDGFILYKTDDEMRCKREFIGKYDDKQ